MSNDSDAEKNALAAFAADKPSLMTSRRHFLAGMRTLATAGVLAGAGIAAGLKSAEAQDALCNRFPNLPRCTGQLPDRICNRFPNLPRCVCFVSGTSILTPQGEVRIDDLRIGDLVTTVTGETKPIKWIAKLRFEKQNAKTWPHDVRPVRIAKDALGEGTPKRDLYLSQSHMVYLGGMLISAASLLNGTTIAVVHPESELLEYFHLELDSHHVVLAEGAPCESLLVSAHSRERFDNYLDYLDRYGTAPNTLMLPFAPVASLNGHKGELKSRLRSMIAPVVDVRRPVDIVRDHLEVRAARLKAAA
jgi:hypothetical protein